MFYYLVWVRSNRYHGTEPLTYVSSNRLKSGAIVQVELQNELVIGFVSGLTSQPRFQTKEITHIFDLPALPNSILLLSQWLQQYYPAPIGILAQQFLPSSLTDKQLEKIDSPALNEPIDTKYLDPLNDEQQNAVDTFNSAGSYILHGITGSGKTRIYLEKTIEALATNRSAIILTPEISLTSQLELSFKKIFGSRVYILHSQQTPSIRLSVWVNILKATEPIIIIGPRSAIFSPVRNLGLIVIDEEHETAYKQEQSPHYQTGRVASYLANITKAILILGSATPSVADYFLAVQKKRPIVALNKLAISNDGVKKEVFVINRKDHDLFTRSTHLSLPLIKAIEKALTNKEQSLLYLNRRGTARIVLCENCSWQAVCPHCDVPLTYHADSHDLRCHSCNYHNKIYTNCPVCGHPHILYKSAGTKAIVEEVNRLFPNATIGRFDTDNLKSERFEQHFQSILDGKIDIIIGTQLLAKGLDLPRLSTLGVILADTSLYLPDFTAQERTFQLLNQILGRIGRGHIGGQAYIQTYHPDHPVIQSAIDNDYRGFYEKELENRKIYFFPPFCYMLKLSTRRASIRSVSEAAEKLKNEILRSGLRLKIEGPAPSFYERLNNKYQWQLIVKAVSRVELLKVIDLLPANWQYDIDPIDLL